MMTIKTQPMLLGLTVCFSSLVYSNNTINIQEVLKNAPKEVPSQAELVTSKDGRVIGRIKYHYIYDRSGLLKEIKASTGEFVIKYEYASHNYAFASSTRVSRITIIFKDNSYVQSDFTWDDYGALSKIVRTGKERGTINLSYQSGYYSWVGQRNAKHRLKVQGHRIVEHQVNGLSFIFDQNEKLSNGIENLNVPITLPTYMAMEYFTTNFYDVGFFQTIMYKPLQKLIDPRNGGRIYNFNNTTALYGYLKDSSVRGANGTTYTWSFSYTDPDVKLNIEKLKDVDRPINIKVK